MQRLKYLFFLKSHHSHTATFQGATTKFATFLLLHAIILMLFGVISW